jgi:membrane protein DedA with SNARE-associated domain
MLARRLRRARAGHRPPRVVSTASPVNMLHLLTHLVEQYGYIAVVILVTVEGFGVPLPGETAVVTAAAFAANGSLSAMGVALAATIGTVLGGSGGYWIGRSGGRSLLTRYGHYVGLTDEKLTQAEQHFVHHGMKTVFFARFVALLRIVGGVLAGVSHMPFGRFSVMNLAGGALWAVTFTALGYLFGENIHLLERRLGLVSALLAIAAVVAIGVIVRRRRATNRASAPTT